MPNENDSNTPSPDPERQSLPQSPIFPAAPHQDEMRKHTHGTPENDENPTRKLERDIKTGEICLIVINGLLLITSIVIALIYFGQLKEMRKATVASEKAATAAASAADIADKTLKEIRTGGTDTHELAVQAKNQADRTQLIAEETKSLAITAETQAENTGKLVVASTEANQQSAHALNIQTRPWIGIQVVSISAWATTANAQFPDTYSITSAVSNYGSFPALRVAYSFAMAPDTGPPYYPSSYSCGDAKRVTENQNVFNQPNPREFVESVFPDQSTTNPHEVTGIFTYPFSQSGSLIECVTYKGTADSVTYNTTTRVNFNVKKLDNGRFVVSDLRAQYVDAQ